MDVDPLESVETDDDDAAANRSRSRLNAWVAVTVALLATFMGICKVKDDNVCQAMMQAQADQIDNWSWYQARNIREDVAKTSALQVEAIASTAAPEKRAAFDRAIATLRGIEADQAVKKAQQKHDAEAAKKQYDDLNYRDDQFDLSDAALALAISLLAVTALTQKRWLYGVAMVPTAVGVSMGLAGLMGWQLHSALLAKWLGT